MLQAFLRYVQTLYCRHEYAMQFERSRLSLQCLHCGKRSNGWSVGRE